MKLGSHVSNNGTLMLEGSAREALSYNANAFMVYLGAPQNSFRKPLNSLNADKMQKILFEHNISKDNVIVHAPYIINLASPDESKRKFGIDFIINELRGCAYIGSKYLVLHPGAHVGLGAEQGIINLVDSLKEIISKTDDIDTFIAIETMAGKGTEIGRNFEEIAKIIDGVNSSRVKVCLDTCHIFDAGYDIVNNYEEVLSEFENRIGLDKIGVIHVNDSKNCLGSHKDRHENIGFGNIGFNSLIRLIYDDRFSDIVKILETPYINDIPPYKYEIEMIKSKIFDDKLKEKFNIILENNK